MRDYDPVSGFSFKGRHCSEFGIYISVENAMLAPPRRDGKVIIPGRSGYYNGITGNVYGERTEDIVCTFICPPDKTVPQVCRDAAAWLTGTGRLVYDKEPDKYYMAALYGGPPVKQLYDYGKFTLSFSINPPFAFGRTVTEPILAGVNAVDYQGTQETPCLIILKNTSADDAVNITISSVKRSV